MAHAENQDPNVLVNNRQTGAIVDYFKTRKNKNQEAHSTSGAKTKRRRHDTFEWRPRSQMHRQKFELLRYVCENDPQYVRIINDNWVCLKGEFLIGQGSNGTAVYICLGIDGIERAIKVLPNHLGERLLNERDILNSWNAIQSPRIVNYYHSGQGATNSDDCYLILNLYEQNLKEYIREKCKEITESEQRQMIRQLLKGLVAIHGNLPKVLHRDLKPNNILVDVKGNLALSDFGIGRILSEEDATTYNGSGQCGTDGWTAFESTNWSKLFPPSQLPSDTTKEQMKWKRKSDIQVAGILAYYIHTKGGHPFGEALFERMTNLRDNKPVGLEKLSNKDDAIIKDLLTQMLAQKIEKRPYAEEALKHPYFLSFEDQMKFIEAIGNESEVKIADYNCAVSKELDNLDPANPRSSLLPNDWKAVIDPDDLNTFCDGGRSPSTYNGKKYTHCLRFIRNVRQHWRDRPRSSLKGMGKATNISEYFLQRFPALPLALHQIVRKYSDWKARLKEFFPEVNRRRELGVADTDAE